MAAKDVFRASRTCTMRDNNDSFCPVCDEDVSKAIVACLGEDWDDAKYHVERPLSEWH